jgi:hypothetical protein
MNRACIVALSVSFAGAALMYALQRWSMRAARRQGDLDGLRARAAALPFVRSGQRALFEADLLFWSGDFTASLDRLLSIEQHRISRRLRVRRAQLGALNWLLLDRTDHGRSWLAEARRCSGPEPSDTERVLAALLDIAEGTSENDRLAREKLFDVRAPLNLLVHLVAATLAESAGECARARAHLETVIAQGGRTFVAERAVEGYRRAFPNEQVPAHAADAPARVSRLAELAQNFWCGQRLLALRRVSVAQFASSPDQLGLLVALNLAFALVPRGLEYTRGAIPLLFSLEGVLPGSSSSFCSCTRSVTRSAARMRHSN